MSQPQYTSIVVGNLSTSEQFVSHFEVNMYADQAGTQLLSSQSVAAVPASGSLVGFTQKNLLYFDQCQVGTTYYFSVAVVDEGGNATWSPAAAPYVGVVAGSNNPPDSTYTPTFTATPSGVVCSVAITTPSSSLSHYEWYANTSGTAPTADTQGNRPATPSGADQTFADLNAAGSTSCYFWIRAVDTQGNKQVWVSLGNESVQAITNAGGQIIGNLVGTINGIEVGVVTLSAVTGQQRNLVPDSAFKFRSTYWALIPGMPWISVPQTNGVGAQFIATGGNGPIGARFIQGNNTNAGLSNNNGLVPVVAGEPYTASMWVDNSNGGGQVNFNVQYENGTPCATVAIPAGTPAGRFSQTFTPTGSVFLLVYDASDSTWASGKSVTMAAPQIEQGSDATAYRDNVLDDAVGAMNLSTPVQEASGSISPVLLGDAHQRVRTTINQYTGVGGENIQRRTGDTTPLSQAFAKGSATDLDNLDYIPSGATYIQSAGVAGQNALENPSFEFPAAPGSGDIAAGWFDQTGNAYGFAPAYESSTTEPHSGTHDIDIEIPAAGLSVPANGNIYSAFLARKHVAAVPGQTWRVGGWVNIQQAIVPAAGLSYQVAIFARAEYSDGNFTQFGGYSQFGNGTSLLPWTYGATTFTVPATPSGKALVGLSIWFTFYIVNTNSAATTAAGGAWGVRFDDLSLVRLTDYDHEIDESGGEYLRMPGANMDANRRGLIDFTQSGHLSKNLDNIGDGSTYVRYVGADATGNRLDFGKSLLNKYGSNLPRSSSDATTLDRAFAKGAATDPDTLDSVADGSSYRRLANVASDNTLHASTSLNNQGSVPPNSFDGSVVASISGTTITVTVTGGTIYRPDGSTIAVPSSAPTFTTWNGVAIAYPSTPPSGTYYNNYYGSVVWDIGTGAVVVLQQSGPTNTSSSSTDVPIADTVGAYQDGYIGLLIGFDMQTTMTSSGGGGGGGGGGFTGCPTEDQAVESQRGIIAAKELHSGDRIMTPRGWEPATVGEPFFEEAIRATFTDGSAITVNEAHFVFRDGRPVLLAGCLPGESVDALLGAFTVASIERIGQRRIIPIEVPGTTYCLGPVCHNITPESFCPTEDQFVLTRDHGVLAAQDIKTGMLVDTPRGWEPVTVGEPFRARAYRVEFTDGGSISAHERHIVYQDGRPVQLALCHPGQDLGAGTVQSVVSIGERSIIPFLVPGRTYRLWTGVRSW